MSLKCVRAGLTTMRRSGRTQESNLCRSEYVIRRAETVEIDRFPSFPICMGGLRPSWRAFSTVFLSVGKSARQKKNALQRFVNVCCSSTISSNLTLPPKRYDFFPSALTFTISMPASVTLVQSLLTLVGDTSLRAVGPAWIVHVCLP